MKITCCRYCTDRHFGCHGYCKDYMEQRAALDNANRDRLDNMMTEEWTQGHGKHARYKNVYGMNKGR